MQQRKEKWKGNELVPRDLKMTNLSFLKKKLEMVN